ncbi:hypothetical protein COEREDRAFT_102053, partial [Coemansia reversa NRRL 1564]
MLRLLPTTPHLLPLVVLTTPGSSVETQNTVLPLRQSVRAVAPAHARLSTTPRPNALAT